MTKMTSRHTGGGLGYVWEKAGDVVDVAPEHAHELWLASHGDIYEVFPEPVAEPEPEEKPDVPFDGPATNLAEAIDAASVTKPKRATRK